MSTSGAVLALALMTACTSSPPREPTPTATAEERPATIADLLDFAGQDDWLDSIEYEPSGTPLPASEQADSVLFDWYMIEAQPEACFGVYALQRLIGVTEDGARADDDAMLVGYWEEDDADGLPIGDVFVQARVFDDADTAAAFLGEADAAAAACPTGYAFADAYTGDPKWASIAITVSEFPGLPAGVASKMVEEAPAPGITMTQRTVLLQHENVVIGVEVQTKAGASFTAADADPLIHTLAERLAEL